MGKSKPKQPVAEYRTSIHFGICASADYISRIVVGEKEAWKGRLQTLTAFNLNKPELFGGPKKEGGVGGQVTYLPGGPAQIMPETLAAKYGKTSATMPAYRGMSSIFFTETPANSRKGFYWSANSPYLRGVWVEAARASVGLEAAYARIWRGVDNSSAIYFALDTSGSMADGFEPGSMRMTNMKAAMTSLLQDMRDNGAVGLDIRMVSWAHIIKTSIQKNNIQTADYDDLIAWIATLTPGGGTAGNGTHFDQAVSQASAFFGGTTKTRRAMAFVTDGVPQPLGSASIAVTTVAGIADLSVYGFNIDLADTTYTAMLDNTPSDGVPVVSGGDPQALKNALQSVFGKAFDSNPAHIIFELLPYTRLGTSAAGTDKPAFEAAALTLFNERFGMSLLWTRQSKIEDFVREIQDHIEAAIFLNPKTGLLTIKLIRGDYDVDTLPVFTPDNCVVTNFSRKLWGETINEIVVSWTNPENEEEETVTAQDSANIAVQDGHIISDSRNYYGVRRRDLAAFLAQRDLRVASAPLASCDLECDRAAWDILPGDVIKLVSPEDGITSIIMRVGPVDYGKPGDSKIKANLVEDIFALPLAEYSVPPPPAWEDSSEDPAVAASTYVFTLPYYMVVNVVDGLASAGTEYPVVFAGVLAAQTGSDTHEFELIGETADTIGNVISEDVGTRSIASRATLPDDIAEEVETLIAGFPDRTTGEGPAVGGFVVIGDSAESEVEMGLVVAADVGGFTIRRGVLDTVPREWAAGTPIWFVNEGLSFIDNEQRSDGETVDYKVLPRTSLGTLDESAAPWISTTLCGRPWLPFRPADVKIEGVAFVASGSFIDASMNGNSYVTVDWAERNRLTEDSIVQPWAAATVTPESGQTTTISVLDASTRAVVSTTDGLTGTTHNLPKSTFGGHSLAIVRVTAKRDGFESLQGHELLVKATLLTADTTLITADTTSITADAS